MTTTRFRKLFGDHVNYVINVHDSSWFKCAVLPTTVTSRHVSLTHILTHITTKIAFCWAAKQIYQNIR